MNTNIDTNMHIDVSSAPRVGARLLTARAEVDADYDGHAMRLEQIDAVYAAMTRGWFDSILPSASSDESLSTFGLPSTGIHAESNAIDSCADNSAISGRCVDATIGVVAAPTASAVGSGIAAEQFDNFLEVADVTPRGAAIAAEQQEEQERALEGRATIGGGDDSDDGGDDDNNDDLVLPDSGAHRPADAHTPVHVDDDVDDGHERTVAAKQLPQLDPQKANTNARRASVKKFNLAVTDSSGLLVAKLTDVDLANIIAVAYRAQGSSEARKFASVLCTESFSERLVHREPKLLQALGFPIDAARNPTLALAHIYEKLGLELAIQFISNVGKQLINRHAGYMPKWVLHELFAGGALDRCGKSYCLRCADE